MKLSIKDICKKYKLSEVYVRRMILQGKIETTKVEIAKNTYKHLVEEAEVLRWRTQVKTSGRRRDDGRNKYNIYGTKEEVEKILEALEDKKLEIPVLRSNLKKIKTN
jgi:hypothetical protein